MRDMILLTAPSGSQLLINEHGMVIESENDGSVVTLPHENYRGNKSRVVVKEPFADIVVALHDTGHLIMVLTPQEREARRVPQGIDLFPEATEVMEKGFDAVRVTEVADPEPLQEPEHVLAEAEIGVARPKRGRRKA